MTDRTGLVVFDCDGVLVDSEPLTTRLWVRMLGEEGLTITPEQVDAAFMGGNMSSNLALASQWLGRPVRADFSADFRHRMKASFESELKPVDGAPELLRALTIPFCVASNGPRMKINLSLTLTGLVETFQDLIFSGHDIDCFKPEPGLFLHAAKSLGVAPERCLVVEDSVTGVQAARRAGMRVLGYHGAGDGSALRAEGAIPIECMSDVLVHL